MALDPLLSESSQMSTTIAGDSALAKFNKYTDAAAQHEVRLLEWFRALRELVEKMQPHAMVTDAVVCSARETLHNAHNSGHRQRWLSAEKMAASAMYIACKEHAMHYWSILQLEAVSGISRTCIRRSQTILEAAQRSRSAKPMVAPAARPSERDCNGLGLLMPILEALNRHERRFAREHSRAQKLYMHLSAGVLDGRAPRTTAAAALMLCIRGASVREVCQAGNVSRTTLCDVLTVCRLHAKQCAECQEILALSSAPAPLCAPPSPEMQLSEASTPELAELSPLELDLPEQRPDMVHGAAAHGAAPAPAVRASNDDGWGEHSPTSTLHLDADIQITGAQTVQDCEAEARKRTIDLTADDQSEAAHGAVAHMAQYAELDKLQNILQKHAETLPDGGARLRNRILEIMAMLP
jgi:transcription initiation factor TFIIIB Brf1 subunit/transcription initiation factor TFIIB